MLPKELVPTLCNPLALQFRVHVLDYMYMYVTYRLLQWESLFTGYRAAHSAAWKESACGHRSSKGEKKGDSFLVFSTPVSAQSEYIPLVSPRHFNKPPRSGGSAPQRNQWLLIKPKNTILKAILTQSYPSLCPHQRP